MGKRKRNSVNPFKKDKERSGKKGNPIYRVAGAGLKPRAGSKKEVSHPTLSKILGCNVGR